MMNGHIESDDSSVAIADNARALNLQLTHQLDRVLRHVVVVKWPIYEISRAAMPHLLRRDHPEIGREEWDPLLRDRTSAAVKQQERRAVPVNLVVHPQTVNGSVGHPAAEYVTPDP